MHAVASSLQFDDLGMMQETVQDGAGSQHFSPIFQRPVKSDDQNTSQSDDATIIQVKTSPPVDGPGVSPWGIVAMVTLFVGAMVWVMRRKLI
jgi:hypothetical protein